MKLKEKISSNKLKSLVLTKNNSEFTMNAKTFSLMRLLKELLMILISKELMEQTSTIS